MSAKTNVKSQTKKTVRKKKLESQPVDKTESQNVVREKVTDEPSQSKQYPQLSISEKKAKVTELAGQFYKEAGSKLSFKKCLALAKEHVYGKSKSHTETTQVLQQPEKENVPVDSVNEFRGNPQVSRPYIFCIKNKSYHFIERFSLNSLEQALKTGDKYDSRVQVSGGFPSITYLDLLRWLDSNVVTIGRIRVDGHDPYDRYNQVQLGHTIYLLNKNANGSYGQMPVHMGMKANQYLITAREGECNFTMSCGWDIQLDLMPEASIVIYLFPSKVASLGKEEQFSPPNYKMAG